MNNYEKLSQHIESLGSFNNALFNFVELSLKLIKSKENEIEKLKRENEELRKELNQKYETNLEEFIQNTDQYELQTVSGRKVEKVYYVGSNTYHVWFAYESKPTSYGRYGKSLEYPKEDTNLIMVKR